MINELLAKVEPIYDGETEEQKLERLISAWRWNNASRHIAYGRPPIVDRDFFPVCRVGGLEFTFSDIEKIAYLVRFYGRVDDPEPRPSDELRYILKRFEKLAEPVGGG